MKYIIELIINTVAIIKTGVKKFFRDVNVLIIILLLSALSIFGFTNFIVSIPVNYSIDDLKKEKNYMLNKRSLKIHTLDCPAVAKMSNKNKIEVKDSITNLVNDGYVVCNRCRAGIRRNNEIIANIVNVVDNLLFGTDINDLPTKEEYLNAIDVMGKWYVDNISTYQCELQEEKVSDYKGELNNVKKYNLRNKKDSDEREYNVATNDKGLDISDLKKDDDILKAKEKAVKNYLQNYNIIKCVGDIDCYPCEYLVDSIGGYDYAGDDCVRFMFSCFNNMDTRFVNLLSKYSKNKWSNINTKILANSNKGVQYAMQKLGFEIYDVRTYNIDINDDNYVEGVIKQIDENFRLEKGDILSYFDKNKNEGHIHFYLSDKENFGWGKVNRIFPQISDTYIDENTKKVICNGEKFTRIYRYVGNSDD